MIFGNGRFYGGIVYTIRPTLFSAIANTQPKKTIYNIILYRMAKEDSDNIMLKVGVVGNALFKMFVYIMLFNIFMELQPDGYKPNGFYIAFGFIAFFSILWSFIAELIKIERHIEERKNNA